MNLMIFCDFFSFVKTAIFFIFMEKNVNSKNCNFDDFCDFREVGEFGDFYKVVKWD